jgi:hypothetical protein
MFNADRWVELEGESTLISALGTKNGYLIVKFHKGQAYRYPNGDHHMDEMLAAESVGKYFHSEVKPLGGQRLGDEWPSH